MRTTTLHGWSEKVQHGNRELWLIVKRGRYLGRFYGNRAFTWHAQVIESGKVIWAGTVNKGVTNKWLIEQATNQE